MPDADLLALLRHGPLDAPSLCQRLAISQPTLSRRIAEAGDAIVRIGRARATRYLAEVLAEYVRSGLSRQYVTHCREMIRK